MLSIDTSLADLKARKQALQLELKDINTQMANTRAHYSESRSNLFLKPNPRVRDHELRKLQPKKERLQAEIQALQKEIAHGEATKRTEKQLQTRPPLQRPVEEPEIELIRVRCKQGNLIITNNRIATELSSFGHIIKSQMLLRSSLTGIDSKLAVAPLFGHGGGYNLTFYGRAGEVLSADLVPFKEAKEILALLGGHQ